LMLMGWDDGGVSVARDADVDVEEGDRSRSRDVVGPQGRWFWMHAVSNEGRLVRQSCCCSGLGCCGQESPPPKPVADRGGDGLWATRNPTIRGNDDSSCEKRLIICRRVGVLLLF